MPPNKLDLAELRRSVDAMTEGPWFYRENSTGGSNGDRIYSVEICGDGRGADCRPWFEGCGFKRWSSRVIAVIQDWAHWTDHPANRDGIIALRNAAPALLTEIERLRKVEEAARELDNFAWSAVSADCKEARVYLQSKIDALRKTLGGENGG